jgi:hypothetical protein
MIERKHVNIATQSRVEPTALGVLYDYTVYPA